MYIKHVDRPFVSILANMIVSYMLFCIWQINIKNVFVDIFYTHDRSSVIPQT